MSRVEAERRREISSGPKADTGSQKGSLFVDDLLDAKVQFWAVKGDRVRASD